jgi:hypothetical protein
VRRIFGTAGNAFAMRAALTSLSVQKILFQHHRRDVGGDRLIESGLLETFVIENLHSTALKADVLKPP